MTLLNKLQTEAKLDIPSVINSYSVKDFIETINKILEDEEELKQISNNKQYALNMLSLINYLMVYIANENINPKNKPRELIKTLNSIDRTFIDKISTSITNDISTSIPY